MGTNYALRVPEVKQAALLYESGLSTRQIADRFHVSAQAVRSALKLMGVQMRDKQAARRLRDKLRPAPVNRSTQSSSHAIDGLGQEVGHQHESKPQWQIA